MVLIADGGSTKTEWRAIEKGGSLLPVFSAGMNPYFISEDKIHEMIVRDLVPHLHEKPGKIWFYGTGCNSEAKNNKIRIPLLGIFTGCDVFVGSDLLGAARALCHDKPGIACIIGTGSNSCFYDGDKITANVSPLGYILGDEGGGAVLGKKLISAVLKKQLPAEIIQKFVDTYRMTTAEILDSVYTKPFPNRFLGQFATFMSENIKYPELREIVESSFDEFITRNILQYPESGTFAVNFTGSIAFHFKPVLEECLSKHGLITGEITLSPADGLVKYHSGESNN